MRKFLMVATAAAALVTAGSASAQYRGSYGYGYQGQYGGGYTGGSDWNYGGGSYSRFELQYRHILDGIRHGLSDGSYSPWQANGFYRELESIRRSAYQSQRYGNYQDGYIQARLASLHQRMHVEHERGHERNDAYGYGYDGGYGNYNGDSNNGYYHQHDDDDDNDH